MHRCLMNSTTENPNCRRQFLPNSPNGSSSHLSSRHAPIFRQAAERQLAYHIGLLVMFRSVPRRRNSQPLLSKNAELCALASYPNIAVKATGAPDYSTAPYPYRNIHDHMHRIFDAFGPGRFFWGTDITRMPCGYRQCMTMFTEELPWLAGRDLERIMGSAVCDWIGWRRQPA
jgi:hypothetical protein